MDVPRWIAERIVAEFTALLTKAEAWSCIGRDPATGDLTIDAMTLPPIRDGLAMWLTDFTIAQRAALQTRFWTVFSDHNDALLTGARDANKKTRSAERRVGKEAVSKCRYRRSRKPYIKTSSNRR